MFTTFLFYYILLHIAIYLREIFASCLKNDLPNAEIVFIINTELKEEIQKDVAEIARHYGVKFLQLQDIDKESGHPTDKGMQAICNQLLAL